MTLVAMVVGLMAVLLFGGYIRDINYALQSDFVRLSEAFASWLEELRDERARAKVLVRMRRLSLGNFGDVMPVGGGVGELRIDYGPGYRLYFVRHGAAVIVLLCGGVKGTQAGKLFAAICAAPAVALQQYGVLRQRRMTCYPAFSDRLSGCTFLDQPVVVDGNCITAQGPASALDFALQLVEQLAGPAVRRNVAEAMLYRG